MRLAGEYSRREFLEMTAGAVLFSGLGSRMLEQEQKQSAWLDPSHVPLPSASARFKRLSSLAQGSQVEPRRVNDYPITGLSIEGNREFDDQLISLMQSPRVVGLSCCIAIDNRLVLTRGYGHLSSVDKGVCTPTSLGFVGSITKPICAMTSLTLAQEGKLNYDDHVEDVLPMKALLKPGESSQKEMEKVTVRMLANHTSGIFNAVEGLYDDDFYRSLASDHRIELVNSDVNQYDLVRRGMSRPFVAPPGTAYNYSGQALQVLGRVIEKVGGQRLDKAMGSRLFAPLGIDSHVTLSYLDREDYANIARGLSAKTGSFIPSPLDRPGGQAMSWHYEKAPRMLPGNHWGLADSCGSSMLSSVDLLRMICSLPMVFSARSLELMLTRPIGIPGAYTGLGWGCGVTNGRKQFGHGGKFGGIRAMVESLWDGVQYSIVYVGDDEEFFKSVQKLVVAYGRTLRTSGAREIGWQHYGFAA